MRKLKIISLAGILATAFLMAACNGNNNGNSGSSMPDSSSEEEPDNRVNVFVLSGQSNMEGNTSFASGQTDLVAQAFADMGLEDPEVCTTDGMLEVMVSTYCAGYGQLDHTNLTNNRSVNATNTENQIQGKFVPAKTGLGSGTSKMGPELGAAYYLKDYATPEKPIFFIKMASNGSGFEQSGTQYNWPVKDANGNFPEINLYHTFAKPFIENNLKNIEDMGYEPVIRGWMWHQGESDCASNKIPVYAQRLGDMVDLFRNDFQDYALDQDPESIAFIDGMVYEGKYSDSPKTSWTTPNLMNAEKQKFADSAENNYIVDLYANEEATAENELRPGNPGGDSMHYNTKSSLRLGMGYGRVIAENNLLDF